MADVEKIYDNLIIINLYAMQYEICICNELHITAHGNDV